MPNWCWNTVEFNGEQKNLENLAKLLNKTIDLQNKTGYGQLLHGLEGSIDGYMFEIEHDLGDGFLNLSFQSRWSPTPNDIVRIAELFNLTFTYSYDESGMEIYGKYTFEYEDGEGSLYNQSPEQEDIDACKFKEDDDEDDERNGFDYEKLEEFIEIAPLESVPILRVES